MRQIQRHAAEVVAAVFAGRNLSDMLAALAQRVPDLQPRQRAAIQDISYSTLRRRGEIAHMLAALVKKPPAPVIEALLAVAVQQLAFGRAAPYAVVDHVVRVAGELDRGGAKGFVNAVLRNFLRQREALMAAAAADPLASLNHPDWWVAAMRRAWPENWQAVLAANNTHPPMTLRVNRRRISREAYLAQLAEVGREAWAVGEDGVRLAVPCGVDQLPGFFDGWCSVQDAGAQYAAPLLDVQNGQRVLDACCAPGGKTGHLLERADIDLTALDVDAQRLKRVEANLARLGLKADVRVGDAAKPSAWWDGRPFDRILADVPCSASGVVRRHPDIKWLRRPADFAQFATQQASMLDALWGVLKPGGKLLFATCSVFPEENHDNLAAFLARHADARRLPLPGLPEDGQLLPNDRHDGFFYALLVKD
jgi:16S rRNA (cytosine967-C5)-methyltransferase